MIDVLKPSAFSALKKDEHSVISNHLATTALSLARWHNITGDKEAIKKAGQLVDRIRLNSSQEGWMKEYTGADPGYQSWCTSSLAQIFKESPSLAVEDLLDNSFKFLEAFANPDGSFANGCGARMTRFFMPGGAELCSGDFPAATRLANFARRFIAENTFVSLDVVDEPNVTPFFNDLVVATTNKRELPNSAFPIFMRFSKMAYDLPNCSIE